MHHKPHPLPSRKAIASIRRKLRWAARRRRAGTGLVLRGACYGVGTGIGSLVALLIERRL